MDVCWFPCVLYNCVSDMCVRRNVCMMLCVCILVCLCACICPHRYVCGVSICVCLYVCGGADVAWMMGFESWWCRAAGST